MNEQKICIIGDGLAGLSAAVILSQQNIKIDLYAGSNKKNKVKNDNRTTAISESSYQFIKGKLNIKNLNIFWPCKEINLFFEHNKNIQNFLNYKERKKNLMYIFENKNLKKNLDKQILIKKNIKLIKKNIDSINYETGSIIFNKKVFSYDLIILSVGAHAKLYDKITQGRSIKKNYKEVAITSTIQHNFTINKVQQFFLKEGPLAILPFSQKNFSVVWSVSNLFIKKNKKFIKKILITKIRTLLKLNRLKIFNYFQLI